jgi:hypothetical protein
MWRRFESVLQVDQDDDASLRGDTGERDEAHGDRD